MSTELTESNLPADSESVTGVFDAAGLVSRKPSSVPPIFEYIVEHAPASPKEIQNTIDVSKSVTFSCLDKLLNLGLVDRPSRGQYEPAEFSLHPDLVSTLCELRSLKQLDLCRFAARVETFETADLTDEFGGHRSALRATARRLSEKGFLTEERQPFEKSPKAYRITESAKRGLARVDIDRYLGRDGRHVSPYPNGIGTTDFRTAYEVEDAHYIAASDHRWISPDEISKALDKNHKKTLLRLADMEDRDLLASKPLQQKIVFEATERTKRLDRDLHLFRISKAQQLDFYTLATRSSPNQAYTPDELYEALVEMGQRLTPQTLNTALEELKRAELVEGNSRTGYRFAQS